MIGNNHFKTYNTLNDLFISLIISLYINVVANTMFLIISLEDSDNKHSKKNTKTCKFKPGSGGARL